MRPSRKLPPDSYQRLPSCSQLLASVEQLSPRPATPIGRARPGATSVCLAPPISDNAVRNSNQVVIPMRRARDFGVFVDCRTGNEPPTPRMAKRITTGPWHSSPSQAHSVRASNVLISHLRRQRKASQARRCIGEVLTLPKPDNISHTQRQNVERGIFEKQEIHKKVEHDWRDLIKHWTLFLEELLPGALKSDPQIKAKNGKPNLPKKVVYQLACKYICTEQGRQEDYENTLRTQPSDPSTKCSETTGGCARETIEDDNLKDAHNDLPKTPTASSKTSSRTVRGLEPLAFTRYPGYRENGVWLTTTTDSGGLHKPSIGQPKPACSSTDHGTRPGHCYDDTWRPPLSRHQ